MADVTFTFVMDEKIHRKLQEISEDEHRTLAGQIRLILEEYVDKIK